MVAWLLPALSAVGSIGGALASNSASRRQSRSQRRARDSQERMYNQTREDLSPFRDSGVLAQNALAFEMGLGERPDGYEGLQASPGYGFARDEALGAVEASAAGRGGLYSGAAMQALQQRGNDLANMEYGNYLARLSGMAGSGQNAAAMQASSNQNFGNALAQSYTNQGDARAAGIMGMSNALTNGLNQGIGLHRYQQDVNMFNKMGGV